MKDIKINVGPSYAGVHGFTTIDHRARRKLGLTSDQYCLMDYLYKCFISKTEVTIKDLQFNIGMEEVYPGQLCELFEKGFIDSFVNVTKVTVTDKWSDAFKGQNDLDKFDEFRKEYLGTKRGNQTEFENFQKKHKDWATVLPLLLSSLKDQKRNRAAKRSRKEFVPEWKNLQTWINQRCWEEEVPVETKDKPTMKGSFL